LERLRGRDYWSLEMWLLVIWLAILLIVVIPWMVYRVQL
jgi:hypothetical protein